MPGKTRPAALLALAATLAAIAGCGSSDVQGTITSDQAAQLNADLDAVEQATSTGDCATATSKLEQFRTHVFELPSSAGTDLKNALQDGGKQLSTLVTGQCGAAGVTGISGQQSTSSSSTKTTSSTTGETSTTTTTTSTPSEQAPPPAGGNQGQGNGNGNAQGNGQGLGNPGNPSNGNPQGGGSPGGTPGGTGGTGVGD